VSGHAGAHHAHTHQADVYHGWDHGRGF